MVLLAGMTLLIDDCKWFIAVSNGTIHKWNDDVDFEGYSHVTVNLKINPNIKIYVELYPVHTLKYLFHKVFIYFFWPTLTNIQNVYLRHLPQQKALLLWYHKFCAKGID